MQPILLSILAIFKKPLVQKGPRPSLDTSGPVRAVAIMLCMTLRLVAFNFSERELKNINFHIFNAQALISMWRDSVRDGRDYVKKITREEVEYT